MTFVIDDDGHVDCRRINSQLIAEEIARSLMNSFGCLKNTLLLLPPAFGLFLLSSPSSLPVVAAVCNIKQIPIRRFQNTGIFWH